MAKVNLKIPEFPKRPFIGGSFRRLSYIKRWSICRTNKAQHLDQHIFGVIWLSVCLYKHIFGDDRSHLLEVYETAVMHDHEEAWMGDVPTPTKMKRDQEMTVAQEVVKAADLVETMLFCNEEHRSGNTGFEKVKHQVQHKLENWQGKHIHGDSLNAFAAKVLKAYNMEVILGD